MIAPDEGLYAESATGHWLRDSLLANLVHKAVEMDCEIRWQEIASQLAADGDAGANLDEEAASDSGADNDDEDIFGGMDVNISHLRLNSCGASFNEVGALSRATSCHEGAYLLL
jgi:hypothetical protein